MQEEPNHQVPLGGVQQVRRAPQQESVPSQCDSQDCQCPVITETAGHDRFVSWELKYTHLVDLNYFPSREGVYKGFTIYHRAAMIMETLTMFYNSKEDR